MLDLLSTLGHLKVMLVPSVFTQHSGVAAEGATRVSKSSRRTINRGNGLNYQQHESRCLLAGITFDATAGEVLIGGTEQADRAVVSQAGSTVTVTQEGFTTRTFNQSEVQRVRFVGLGGDDYFENQTAIRSFAYGQAGNDRLIGGSNDDHLIGNTGDDVITGNAGDDYLVAGNGDDVIAGGAGNDRFLGVRGFNELNGGDGDDIIYGGIETDIITGGAGENLLVGNAGADQIFGGENFDRVFGGSGNDTIQGAGETIGSMARLVMTRSTVAQEQIFWVAMRETTPWSVNSGTTESTVGMGVIAQSMRAHV